MARSPSREHTGEQAMTAKLGTTALLVLLAAPVIGRAAPPELPTPAELAAAREDVWGEAAIRAPDGPSYEVFRDLLPPLPEVNTAFGRARSVLRARRAPVKARWVSNGSGVTLRADKPPMWKEAGVPVAFLVGALSEPFGEDVARLDGPQFGLFDVRRVPEVEVT